jgi:hypothetical protein
MNTMNTCAACRSEFSCGKLATALAIVRAMPDLEQWPRLARAAAHIERVLAQAGWRYPSSVKLCELAPRTAKIQALTRELIDELDRVRFMKGRGERDPADATPTATSARAP